MVFFTISCDCCCNFDFIVKKSNSGNSELGAMANITHNNFSFNFKHILIDEIALNGLEGIGLASLWNRVEKRISSPVTMKMKARFWKTIVNCKEISFYQNPVPVECVEVLDRFSIVHEETGQLTEPVIYLDGEYEYHPVSGQYGSCVHFDTRIPELRESLQQLPYETMEGTDYMDRLVMVASIEERWRALADHKPISYLTMMNPMHYCILELVGKGRDNGQMTQGKTNLVKIVKDPKFLFYNRNFLQKLDLIRQQHLSHRVNDKLCKSLILRLKRFHQPPFLSAPKVGKLRNLIDYLMDQPDNSEKTQVVIEKGLLTRVECKRLQKTYNVFDFEERPEPPKSPSQNKKGRISTAKYMTLTCPSESESGESDNDEDELPCQFKVGIALMRQAYELLAEAGLKGLTQIELGQLLGVEFYTSRNICRELKANNIIREFLEDKGKQRTARYITVNATREMDVKYENEKQKLLNYISETKTSGEAKSKSSSKRLRDDNSEIPNKKPKVEKEFNSNIVPDINVMKQDVTEIKVLEGLENFKANSLLNSKKNLTLRQLRFANGVLKVLRERLAVSGYCTLSALVAKEINEPPLDAKRLKMFIQKLVTDGQVKILKMKWPGPNQNYTHLLCAPHVMPTDQVIVTKYRELCLRAIQFEIQKPKKKRIKNEPTPEPSIIPIYLHTYPKYMKIQKLHEFVTKVVYFEREDTDLSKSDTPEGFASLVYLIPEMTVEFAMSNMKQTDLVELLHSTNNIDKQYYDMKLKDTPAEINSLFLKTAGLQENIKYNLKILSILGLVQLIREPNQVGSNFILTYSFYVNRNACILDTTGKWPRPGDTQHLEKKYHFETFQDVERYWQDVYCISTKTDIQLETKDRQRKKFIPVLRLKHEVHENDNGARYGDGLGMCGFDASFYMDAARFWSSFYCKFKKKHQLQLMKQPFKLAKKEKKPKVKPVKMAKAPVGRKPRTRKVMPTPKPKPTVPKPKAPRTATSGIKWSTLEDQMLMLSKAAVTVMSPVPQPGSLRIRNIVAKEVLQLNDPKKIASVCHLRAQALETNTTLTYQKECLINELRYRGNIMKKYDGLMKKIRLRHAGNLSKFMQEARLPMMELMFVLYQIFKSDSFNQKSPCVALSYEKFHDDFTICAASSNKGMNLYRTPLDVDPKIAALKEGTIMCVMLSFQNEQPPETAQKVYEMFNHYPETTLRVVIEQVRKCGAVAAREKLINNVMSKVFLQEIVQSSYKVAVSYKRKWVNILNSEFVDKLNACLDQEIEPPESGVKGSPEVNCFLNEMHASNAVEIFSVSVPVVTGSSGSLIQDEQMTVRDIFMKYDLKTGTFGWKPKFKAKKFKQIFDDIEVEESLKELARNSTVEITQHTRSTKTETFQDQNIISHLKNKKEAGSTFPELQEVTGYDSKTLCELLRALEIEKVVKRIGYYENIVILTEFAKPWTLTLGDREIIPTPWLTLEQDKIRRDIFLKWAGVIVNTVVMYPGCSIAYLSDYCEFLTTRSAQDLCVTLERFGCLKLNVLKDTKPNWWSEDDIVPQLEVFNEFDLVENIVVFPVNDSFTRFAYVRRKILEHHGK